MIRLIIQIPCLNESEHLPATIAALPKSIAGIDKIEILVIDDGSDDGTAEVALRLGVDHIIRHRRNRGLAAAFRNGLDYALRAGADIIVNTDADGQYRGEDIKKLVEPIVAGKADIVIGDRQVGKNHHFGPFKRQLQSVGSRVVGGLSRTDVADAVSGFRALSRSAAEQIHITTDFSYTTDMLIQAGRKRLAIASVPISTNPAARESRLFRSIPHFVASTGVTIARCYLTYNPLRLFLAIGMIAIALGTFPIARFLWFWSQGDGMGHVQSLVIGSALLVIGVLMAMLGLLADLIGTNRRLLESALYKIGQLERGGSEPLCDLETAQGPSRNSANSETAKA